MLFQRLAVVCGALLALLAAANASAVTLQDLRDRGVVRIGIANEAPYAYMNLSGTVTGEAPELARILFRQLGIDEVRPIIVEFGSLIPGLKAGRFDVIAAGMYITPARCAQIAFSQPSYKIGEGFLVKRGNPKDLHSYTDVMRDPAIRLGIVAGTVERGYARAVGIPEGQIVILPDNPAGLSAVTSGRVDAYAGTSLTVARLAGQVPGVDAATPFTDPVIDGETIAGYGGFGFRTDSTGLRDAFDGHLTQLLGTDNWRRAVEPFGFGDHTLPDKSREDLCN